MLIGLGALVVVGGIIWNLMDSRDLPDRARREYVEAELAKAEGVLMALPVDLPPGYGPANFWGSATGPDGTAVSRDVTFFPSEAGGADGRIVGVQMCVESASDHQENCVIDSDNNSVVRRVEDIRVVIDLSDHDPTNRAAWQSVPFTTDLNKVRWLH
ncbi:hypothetical protein [Actinopolymorpha alba]|uniref:hypothetical protein n=1 Tax=Actinopolymorpha alba TaxID=533267 RepID=UPI00037169A8|nr:hypothetical protein [Actinopolymorpha alba]